MFALMTTFWILSVFFTTQYVNSLNKSVTMCNGSNNSPSCVLREVAAIRTSLSASAWLSTLFDILLINVSTMPYRVTSSTSIPLELTRFLEF